MSDFGEEMSELEAGSWPRRKAIRVPKIGGGSGVLEDKRQIAIVNMVRRDYPKAAIYAVENETRRKASQGAMLHRWRMGVTAGFPDLITIWPGLWHEQINPWPGDDEVRPVFVLLEMKRDGGVESGGQVEVARTLERLNVPRFVVVTVEEAREAFRKVGVIQ